MGRPRKIVPPGTKFGSLTVIGEAATLRYPRSTVRQMRVLCDCGTSVTMTLNNIVQGRSTNCGCKRNYYPHALKHRKRSLN